MRLPAEGESDISIVLCGEAGQGIQTVEKLLVSILKKDCYHVYSFKEYMSRIRGGVNSTTIRVSPDPVRAYRNSIDIFVPLSGDSIHHAIDRFHEGTLVLRDPELVGDVLIPKGIVEDAGIMEMARNAGSKVLSNVVASGILLSMFEVDQEIAKDGIRSFFSKKSAEIVEKNIKAFESGFKAGREIAVKLDLELSARPDKKCSENLLLDGADAVSLGALAGGCNFISSYPMSPSTGVLTYLSKVQRVFSLIAEQAEDEISAINMAIGAWYAGARALVTTSGGGFDLMTEGLSLAGMIETPLVIHLSQRPGPATGLPTRTEQSDLMLALHSGHGEFPRAIFAPGDLEEAFELTRKAFDLADACQVPVIVLTDQYLMDTYYDLEGLDVQKGPIVNNIVRTDGGYKRYADSPNGISERGVPGHGTGLVMVDSDEHGPEGRITEDMNVRNDMMDKRMRKLDLLREKVIDPSFNGDEDYRYLVVGWGSTKHVIMEALKRLGRKDVSSVHLPQIYPLPDSISELIFEADEFFVVENNATSQLNRLMMSELETPRGIEVLQYDGLPFSADGLADRLKMEIEAIEEAG
jgi:2-oxoglutarate ferredoxin oxidoreductase subunit alpha